MKKILFTMFLFVSIMAQAQLRLDALDFQGKVTSTIRDAYVVPLGHVYTIWNSTTGQFEYAESDNIWRVLNTDDQTLAEVLTSGNSANGLNIFNVGTLDFKNSINENTLGGVFNGSGTKFTFYPNPDTGYTTDALLSLDFSLNQWEIDNSPILTVSNASSNGFVGTDDQTATEVPITDIGANFTATNVEDALAELAGASGGLANVVEDLTPQLGGFLDANDFSIQNIAFLNIRKAAGSKINIANSSNLEDWSFGNDLSPTGVVSALGDFVLDYDSDNATNAEATWVFPKDDVADNPNDVLRKKDGDLLYTGSALSAEQAERIANMSKKKVISVTSNTTLANANFEPLTPDSGKQVIHTSGGPFTITIPTGITAETATDFKVANIGDLLTFEAATGVTLYGRDIDNLVITNGFTLDSLERVTVTPLGSDVFSIDGYVKKLDVVSLIYDTANAINPDVEANATIGLTCTNCSINSVAVDPFNGIYTAEITITANGAYNLRADLPNVLNGENISAQWYIKAVSIASGHNTFPGLYTSDGWLTGTNDATFTTTLTDWTATTNFNDTANANAPDVRLISGTGTAGDVIKIDNLVIQ